MRTTISVRDETVRRVDGAARRLGISRGEFFAQAAERWPDALDDDTATAINDAIAELADDHAFTDTAAAAPPLDEVRQLAADEADAEEMRSIRAQLADIGSSPPRLRSSAVSSSACLLRAATSPPITAPTALRGAC